MRPFWGARRDYPLPVLTSLERLRERFELSSEEEYQPSIDNCVPTSEVDQQPPSGLLWSGEHVSVSPENPSSYQCQCPPSPASLSSTHCSKSALGYVTEDTRTPPRFAVTIKDTLPVPPKKNKTSNTSLLQRSSRALLPHSTGVWD